MKNLHFEDYQSDLFYRVKYVYGKNAANSTRKDYHYSPNYILIFFIQGSGNIKINGTTQHLSAGDMILLNPSEFFLFNVEDGFFHERIVLFIKTSQLQLFYNSDYKPLFSALYETGWDGKNIIPAETVKKQGLDKPFFDLLNAARDRGPFGCSLTACKAVEILCLARKTLADIQSTVTNHTTDPLFNEILQYLHEHHKENICIDDITTHFNVQRSYLLHKFKKVVGISLWNYVILQRIYSFNSQIKKDSSIEQTAYNVGFSNYSNFFRLYKKNMGITPLEFKQRFKNS